MNGICTKIFGVILVNFLAIASLFAIPYYPGSSLVFLLFDFVWLVILFLCLTRPKSYSWFFIGMMLFLGFWAKAMLYFLVQVFPIEPIGYWIWGESSYLWDRVLMVSIVSGIGVMASYFIVDYLLPFQTKKKVLLKPVIEAKFLYFKYKNLVWLFLIISILILNFLNVIGQLNLTALPQKWVLPLHMNALFDWLLIFVTPLCLSLLISWEYDNSSSNFRLLLSIIFLSASLTAITTLSRATYPFWTIPLLIVFFSKNASVKNIGSVALRNKSVICTYLILAVITLYSVQKLRAHYYLPQTQENHQKTETPTISHSHQDIKILPTSHAHKIIQTTTPSAPLHISVFFPIERWIGLEAIMATTAFQEGGMDFFKTALLEKPSFTDRVGIYTQKVLALDYHPVKNKSFSSLPGLVGFLNYSQSLPIVFIGIFIISLVLISLEKMSSYFFNSPFLNAQQGIILSYWCVSGLNIPYLGVINFLECLFVNLVFITVMLAFYYLNSRRAHTALSRT